MFKQIKSKFQFPTNKIYIFPNRFGILYLFVIFTMILVAATYNNNLVFLLSFFLFSVFITTMVQTHNNLKGLHISLMRCEDGFEGEFIALKLKVFTNSRKVRQSVRVVVQDKHLRAEIPGKAEIVAPEKPTYCDLTFRAIKRGKYSFPKLRVYTIYPMGLFQAWKFLELEGRYFVYPKPIEVSAIQPPQDLNDGSNDGKISVDSTFDADFKEHKKYHPGDSFQHIDWKARARGRPLLVKSFQGEAQSQVHFEYDKLKPMASEDRLKQLSYWICQARAKDFEYALSIGEMRIQISTGQTHFKNCMRALAIHGGGDIES